MTVVTNLTHEVSELVPAITFKRAEVLHVARETFGLLLVGIGTQFFVDQTLNVILVCRPHASLLIPDRIERSTADHKILRSSDAEIWINLQDAALGLTCANLIEIHLPSSRLV